MQTVDTRLLKNNSAISLSVHKLGLTRKVDSRKTKEFADQSKADENRVKASKKIIEPGPDR